MTIRLWPLLLLSLALTCGRSLAADTPHLSTARTPADAGLMDIRKVAPDIAEDMKYAAPDNFTGARVPGYLAPACLLRTGAARALAQVESDLRPHGYRLRLWDCYRPARAVAAFVRWAGDLSDTRTRASHYPALRKDQLLGEYIAPVSGHSKGATVDLTLMRCEGVHCTPLDMGTDFDFFDPLAHTDDPRVTPLQHENRQRLLKAMAARGFVNYPQEWWHFSLPGAADGDTIYDVPVQ
ncbi:M15 family metallopeptidase [Dyella sp. 333MFSha]|uniref:M15 family metallopeptidase n=1 Tax=Dyella sp. 333MFSha TaxID=1798240 RepID=UPI0008873071|nr:M15 family metallopeptidase [Dyella sp. 333MFSha]SDF95634.1 D-Ala-D-Ala dipeptidase vanX. Metallo peptidase. MEROPS family M15D [Dyella sp. 333MFSha]